MECFNRPTLLERFAKDVSSSHGSVRNQVVHLVSVDDAWFSGLRDIDFPVPIEPANFDDRKIIRAHWDNLEQNMHDYLAKLRDNLLFEAEFLAWDETITNTDYFH